jgi:hypothetical protein
LYKGPTAQSHQGTTAQWHRDRINSSETSPKKRCEGSATQRRKTRPKKVLFSGNKTQRDKLHTTKVSRSTDRIKLPRNTPKNGAMTQQPNAEKHALRRCCSPETRRKERYVSQRRRDPLLLLHRSQKRNKLFKQGDYLIHTGGDRSEFSIPPKGEWSSTMERPTI